MAEAALLQRMIDGIDYVHRHAIVVEAVPSGPVSGARPADAEVARVRLPASPANSNIAGGLHAAALFCLAETAAGIAAWCIQADPATMVYVRKAEVGYPRRGSGDVVAEARVTRRLGSDAEVEVTAADSTGREVLAAAFSYALRRVDGSPGTPAA